MTRPAATVVIACHTEDRLAALERAVASVRDQTLVPARTVVVVDHNPALYELLRTRLVGVELLENGSARGASGARNTGAAVATTPVVAFLDDDARAHPEWLEALLRPFDDPSVIGTGGQVDPDWLGPQPNWFPDEFGWVVGASYRGLPTTQARVRNVWGENMAVRKAVFDTVGGFRAGFGKTGDISRPEDTDLCLRMARAVPGGSWVHVPDAVVDHLVPPGRATFGFFLRRCLAEGRGKAEMAAHLGDEPLESERQYLRRTLPAGVVRHLKRAEEHTSPWAAAAIVAGVAAAGAGFVQATATAGAGRRRPELAAERAAGACPEPDASAPRAAVVCDLEIGAGLGDIRHLTGSGAAQLWGLVRVFQEPVGMVQADWPSEPVTPEVLVALVEEQCGPTVRRRLAEAGVPVDGPLPTVALEPPSVPSFLRPLDGAVPSLTVVLCTRDRPEGVAAVLDSLVAQHEPRFDVLVVDNAPSGQDTATVVARFKAGSPSDGSSSPSPACRARATGRSPTRTATSSRGSTTTRSRTPGGRARCCGPSWRTRTPTL